MLNEPIIWVCVGIITFLCSVIIKFKFWPNKHQLNDNSSDNTDALSDIDDTPEITIP
jgi:hypothetical protein